MSSSLEGGCGVLKSRKHLLRDRGRETKAKTRALTYQKFMVACISPLETRDMSLNSQAGRTLSNIWPHTKPTDVLGHYTCWLWLTHLLGTPCSGLVSQLSVGPELSTPPQASGADCGTSPFLSFCLSVVFTTGNCCYGASQFAQGCDYRTPAVLCFFHLLSLN